MTADQERDRYKLALEEILLAADSGLIHTVYDLAVSALDLTHGYPFDGGDPARYLGIHPSNDPRRRQRGC